MTWFRRHRLPLIIIAVSVPAFWFLFVALADYWGGWADRDIETVAQGESAEALGYTFTLTRSAEFPGEGTDEGGNQIPVGYSLIGAIVEIEAGPDAEEGYCDTLLSSRSTGVEREWWTVNSPSSFAYGIGEDRTTTCLFDGESFELESVFLVPAESYDVVTLDLTVDDRLIRFDLAPAE